MTACKRCGITAAELKHNDQLDYFTETDVPGERLCTTCIRWAEDDRIPAILAASNRRYRILHARLRLAEDVASLFKDHLHGCLATTRERDAITEWHHAAGIREIPEDDTLRSEL